MVSRIRHQVLIADAIIINKADLAGRTDIVRIREHMRKINPVAQVFETSYCRINLSFMESGPAPIPLAHPHAAAIHSIEQFRPEMGVGVFKSGRKVRLSDLQNLISFMAETTIRIKGNVLLADGQTALVQTVFNDININLAENIYGSTCLVLMGEDFNLSDFNTKFSALTI
jgi:G3E family GTPase